MKNIHKIKEHIYITSDEEIKVEDWYTINSRYISKCVRRSKTYIDGSFYTFGCKKIILTTDQDLIKDGVQSIDDEFLEWFVKNPSCEEVEIFDIRDLGLSVSYKIIITKKEPEQEIIEQAAEDFYALQSKDYEDDCDNPIFDISRYLVSGFIDGVKWQQERMYSEEEVLSILEARENYLDNCSKNGLYISLKGFFGQFKKK